MVTHQSEIARLQQANQQLQELNHQLAATGESELRALFDVMPQLGWTAQADGFIGFYNRGWYEYTGTTYQTMQGWGWKTVHDPAMLETVLARWQNCLTTQAPFEMEFKLRRHDGNFRWFLTRVAPIRGKDGSVLRWVGINTDIQDQKEATEKKTLADAAAARRQIEEERDRLLEMTTDMVGVAGLDGYFKRLNPAWTKMLGWSTEELVSRPWLDFVHPEDVASTIAAGTRLGEGEIVANFANRYRCKNGAYRWLDWRAVPLLERGEIYAIARDVTEQKAAKELQEKTQRQLILADRMVSIGTLAAGVAHEINTPLAYLMANLDMVAEELQELRGESPSARIADLEEMLGEARQGADRVRKIVRGLKTFSRADDDRRTVIELKAVLEVAVNMTFTEIRHRARLVKDYGKAPRVIADDARLGQVFINLLVNAAQAIPEGNTEANEIRIITSTDERGWAVVAVRDTGAGIPQSVVARVFDPFFTTKAVGVGTGLGLSICHNIIAGMGGEISVISEEGQGATFRIALPPAPDDGQGPSREARAVPGGRKA